MHGPAENAGAARLQQIARARRVVMEEGRSMTDALVDGWWDAAWIERSPTLATPQEAVLRRRLLKAFGESLGLVDVG